MPSVRREKLRQRNQHSVCKKKPQRFPEAPSSEFRRPAAEVDVRDVLARGIAGLVTQIQKLPEAQPGVPFWRDSLLMRHVQYCRSDVFASVLARKNDEAFIQQHA